MPDFPGSGGRIEPRSGSFLQVCILRSCFQKLRKAGKHGWSRKHQRIFPPVGTQTLQEAAAEREKLKPGKQGAENSLHSGLGSSAVCTALILGFILNQEAER